MSAPQLLITIGRVDVGVGLQGEKQRDSEGRREETRAKQLRNQQQWTICWWLMQEEVKEFQKLERFGGEKSHFWICGLKERLKGVQLQKKHII